MPIACLCGGTHRFHCVCHFFQSCSVPGIAARLPKKGTRERIRALILSWLLSSVITGVAVGRVWYAMIGSGTAAGCEDGGAGGQEDECEDCDGEWVMCLHGEGYLGSGMESRKFVVMSSLFRSEQQKV